MDNRSVGAVSAYTFVNATTTHTIIANFVYAYYTITASSGPNGTISPRGSISVRGGSNQTFTITPNSGYRIANVLVDGASVGPVNSYTFVNVAANHTISAQFTTVILGGIDPGGPDRLSPSDTAGNMEIQMVPGDINGDGVLNAADIAFGMDYLRGNDKSMAKLSGLRDDEAIQAIGDANGDCVFDGLDINCIIQFLKGRGPAPRGCGK